MKLMEAGDVIDLQALFDEIKIERFY